MGNNHQYPPPPSLIREGEEKNNPLSLWEREQLCEQSERTTAGEGHPSSGMMCHLFPQRGEGLNVMLKVRVNDNLRRHPELCLTAFAEIYDFEQNVPMRAGSQEIQKPGSQPALEKMLKHGGQSDVQHDINLFLKRTYSPVHLFSYSLRKRAAFTLAEVLITLGIIGVVAAMTIPTLITTYNKRVVETRLEKFYSSMNQAIRMAELDYGARELWFEDNSDRALQEKWCKKYIIPYMNVVKTDSVYVSGVKLYTIYFADGSSVSMPSSNGRDWYFCAGDIQKCFDNYGNMPKASGKCSFAFYYNPVRKSDGSFYQWNFEPYMSGWDDTENSLKNHQNYGCYNENVGSKSWRAYCTRLIQYNGWRIPDDYPFRVKY